jgi:hypothetical protein
MLAFCVICWAASAATQFLENMMTLAGTGYMVEVPGKER